MPTILVTGGTVFVSRYIYREAFVFDCALENRKFYLPENGEMQLQFFHVHDLCRFIDAILDVKPYQHIFNVGNQETVSIREWVELCYGVLNKPVEFISVHEDIDQRKFFSFYDYEYYLDVTKQFQFIPDTKPLFDGLQEAYDWYKNNQEQVSKKPFMDYIDAHLNNYNK